MYISLIRHVFEGDSDIVIALGFRFDSNIAKIMNTIYIKLVGFSYNIILQFIGAKSSLKLLCWLLY